MSTPAIRKVVFNCLFLISLLSGVPYLWAQGTGRVAVYGPNPRYLQDAEGRPFVIIGFGREERPERSVLDQLKGKINYQRVYAAWWHRNDHPDQYCCGRPWVMVRGNADMNVWNETYWSNLHDYLRNARERDIVVGLTIWDGHSWLPGGKFGDEAVWNSQYNVQGVQWAYDYAALVNFPNPQPTGGYSERLVYHQRRWVDRLIGEIKAYPNILIELDNETDHASESWFLWWADYFIQKGDFVIATTWNSKYTISDETFSRDPRLNMKSYHSRTDEAITTARLSWNKVIVADADNKCSNLNATIARKIAWRSFIKGGHWNDFVCGATAFPDSTKIRYYGHLLNFIKTRSVPFAEMSPNNSLVSNGNLLSKLGRYYLAYIEGKVNLDLRAVPGILHFEWYNPRTGNDAGSGRIQGGTVRTFSPPSSGDFVLWVRDTSMAPPNSLAR